MKNYLVQCLIIFVFFNLSIGAASAFEEEHEAHEHGHATLMLVQENDELRLLFKSPAMNITGFEHQASTPEQVAKVEWAKQSLSDAAHLFLLSQSAECVLEHLGIESSLLEEAEDHHDDHDSHAEGEHSKDDKGSHSEFEAEYHFECKNIRALKELSLTLFEVFKSLEEIEVQIINDAGQTLHDLDRHNPSIKL